MTWNTPIPFHWLLPHTYTLTPQVVGRRLQNAETRVRDPRPVYVGFIVHKVALEKVSVTVLRFSPVRIIPPMLHTRCHASATKVI